MAASDPSTRARAAQAAALTRWGRAGGREDRARASQPARDGLRARFEREADPEGKLTPEELAEAVDKLHRAHMLRMSLKAAAARRKIREASAELAHAEAELTRQESNDDAA